MTNQRRRVAGRMAAAIWLLCALAGVPAVWSADRGAGPAPAVDLQAQIKATSRQVLPAIVSIAATVMIPEQALSEDGLPFGSFRDLPQLRRQYGQGSGVLVSSDGYLITNHHVVAEASGVEVLLADRRQFKGRVVATDPKTDVAIVKIQATGLPTVSWGDSGKLAVGDFVLAVGNPLGLSQTVTFGIVSAVGRADVGVADYEDFIQTDAPINPGNSGGALVNIAGELVGINTAIASPTGGSVGVGFAIPSNMVKQVMQSLLKTGRVVRGFFGAMTQDITPVLSHVFKLPDVKGAVITDLQAHGSAERAGLRRGDVVVRVDGRDILDGGHLRNVIALAPVGSRHRIEIVREGRLFQTDLIVQEAPGEPRRKTDMLEIREGQQAHPLAGILVDELTSHMARQMGLTVSSGLVVTDLEEGSLAESAGMQPGDVILEVNQRAVPTLLAYQRAVDPIKPKDLALLLVNRQGTLLYVPIQTE